MIKLGFFVFKTLSRYKIAGKNLMRFGFNTMGSALKYEEFLL